MWARVRSQFRPAHGLWRSFATTGAQGTGNKTASGQTKAKTGVFAKVKSILADNKQAIINVFAVYFTLSLAINNYRLNHTLKEKEAEIQRLQEKLNPTGGRSEESSVGTTLKSTDAINDMIDAEKLLQALAENAEATASQKTNKPRII